MPFPVRWTGPGHSITRCGASADAYRERFNFRDRDPAAGRRETVCARQDRSRWAARCEAKRIRLTLRSSCARQPRSARRRCPSTVPGRACGDLAVLTPALAVERQDFVPRVRGGRAGRALRCRTLGHRHGLVYGHAGIRKRGRGSEQALLELVAFEAAIPARARRCGWACTMMACAECAPAARTSELANASGAWRGSPGRQWPGSRGRVVRAHPGRLTNGSRTPPREAEGWSHARTPV
jgi:hypothetical protein